MSIFPILASDAVKSVPPFLTLFLTIFVALCIFIVIVACQKKFHEFANLQAWKYGLIVGVVNTVFFYGFYYLGLSLTTPGNGGLIALTEIGFSFLFFQMWHKEALSKQHIFGIILLIIGAVYLLLPKADGFNIGDIIILASMACPPLGNFYQKKGRALVSVNTFLTMRYATALPFLVLCIYFFREPIQFASIVFSWEYIVALGVLIFTIKNICWVEAIRHVTVTRVLALHGFAPLLTIMLLWIFRDVHPTYEQLLSSIPMVAGVFLLTR